MVNHNRVPKEGQKTQAETVIQEFIALVLQTTEPVLPRRWMDGTMMQASR